MTETNFTADELAILDDYCQRVPLWHHWRTRKSASGNEVIEIAFSADGTPKLMLIKTEDGRYGAAGFDGWSLTVSDEFVGLLEILARMVPAGAQFLRGADRERSAA